VALRSRGAAWPFALIVTAAGLVGCAGAAPAPADIAVAVYQPRTDVAAERIAITIENLRSEPLEITGARLESPGFAEPMTWPGERAATVQPGRAVDLRVPLVPPDCAADPPVTGTVVLTYRQGADDVDARLPLPAGDDRLPALWRQGCLASRVAEVATIGSADFLWTPGVPEAVLVVDIVPTGREGTVRLLEAAGTTLLSPAQEGRAVPRAPLDIAVSASDPPSSLRVPMVPNRCDAHALAEDKVGTRIPLLVETEDGSTGRLVLAASDALRERMYGFFVDACAL